MTDAWEMHPETGLNPGPTFRDRGVIIANLTARNQALEERVAELELAALNLRDNTQGAHEREQALRKRLISLADEIQRDGWCDPDVTAAGVRTLAAPTAAESGRVRAEAAEADTSALREHLTALADTLEAEADRYEVAEPVHWRAMASATRKHAARVRRLAASPAVEGSQIPTPPATAGTDATPEPTPADECTCRGMDEKPGCTHGFPSPAAEPQAEGGAPPDIGEVAVLAAALIETGHTEREAVERAIHLLRPAPVADPSGNTP